MPPAMPNITSRMVVPMGTSTSPVNLTFPERANTLVPLLLSVPMDLYFSMPPAKISGNDDNVSTLLITVGLPNKPLTAGNGGRGRGIPLFPSMELIKAVSSPQTKAPAPILTLMSKSIPAPKIFLPRTPSLRACSRAMFNRLMASGYSARIYTYPFVAPIP